MEVVEILKKAIDQNASDIFFVAAMFVTPKDIDEAVKRLSYTISEGLNLAFSRF